MNKDEFQNTSSGMGRKLFLVVVLLAVLGAFGYDYFVAKPAYEEGYQKLSSMLEPKKENDEAVIVNGKIVKIGDLDGDGYITPEDVRKMMGREPKTTETPEETTVVETYTWSRGIPLMTYNAYAVYFKGDKNTTLFSVSERKPETTDYRKKATTIEERPADLKRAAGGGPPPVDEDAKKDGPKKDEAKQDPAAGDAGEGKTEAGEAKPPVESSEPEKATEEAPKEGGTEEGGDAEKADDGKAEEKPTEGGGEEGAGEGN